VDVLHGRKKLRIAQGGSAEQPASQLQYPLGSDNLGYANQNRNVCRIGILRLGTKRDAIVLWQAYESAFRARLAKARIRDCVLLGRDTLAND